MFSLFPKTIATQLPLNSFESFLNAFGTLIIEDQQAVVSFEPSLVMVFFRMVSLLRADGLVFSVSSEFATV